MDKCIICDAKTRVNHHRLDSSLLPITYESSKIITSLSLPRKYTGIYNDNTKQLFINIGHNYDMKLINSDTDQSRIIGKWVKKHDRYQIYFTVLVSTKKNPDAKTRKQMFCSRLGLILEGFVFAETALLQSRPALGATKIFIYFKSNNQKYERTEYWHRLDYWKQSDNVNHEHSMTGKESVISSSKKEIITRIIDNSRPKVVDSGNDGHSHGNDGGGDNNGGGGDNPSKVENNSDISYEDSSIKMSVNDKKKSRVQLQKQQPYYPQVCHSCQNK